MNHRRATPTSATQPLRIASRPAYRWLRTEKIAPAYWTVTGSVSIIVNIVLLVVVIVLAAQLFEIKKIVNDQLIGGLYSNFVRMDEATIRTTIPVKTSVPAKFDLPLKTQTSVRLTQDTYISGARVSLYGGVVTINSAPTDIILPAGTLLPVELDLTVPVDQQIPVELMVDVNIPLKQTELHQPFTGLQQVLDPYYRLLSNTPNSWTEVLCGSDELCGRLFP